MEISKKWMWSISDVLAQLFLEAENRLEANEFSEATKAYKEYLRRGGILEQAIANLVVAEKQERLAFWRDMALAQPMNIRIQYVYLQEMIASRYSLKAYTLCGTLLLRPFSEADKESVRWSRIRAALKAGVFETLIEDVYFVLNHPCTVAASGQTRLALLQEVVKASGYGVADALDSLAKEPWIDGDVRLVLNAKVAVLRILDTLTLRLKREIDDTRKAP